MGASRTGRKIPGTDRADLLQLRGMAPDVEEFLPPHIAAGKRKLHTGKHVAVGGDVAGGVAGTARETAHDVLAGRRRGSAKLFHVAHQFLVVEDLLEVGPRNAQGENGSVTVHLRSNSGVERVTHSQFPGQRDHASLVGKIARHEYVGDDDLQPLGLQETDRPDGSLQ